MSKRTPVSTLQSDPVIGELIQKACINGHLKLPTLLSEKLVATLKMLSRLDDKGVDLSYIDIQDLAREEGISDNLSKTTIRQAKEIICGVDVSSRKKQKSYDVVYYAIKTHLTPLLMVNSESKLDDDELKDRIYAILVDLIVPIFMLKEQYRVTPSLCKEAPFANQLSSAPEASCRLFVTLLKDRDLSLKTYNLQTLALRKANIKLSYATIKKIERTAEWVKDSYSENLSVIATVVDAIKHMKTVVDLISELKCDALHDAVSSALFSLLEAALLSKDVKGKLLFKA